MEEEAVEAEHIVVQEAPRNSLGLSQDVLLDSNVLNAEIVVMKHAI